MEDRIRQLCSELLATTGDEERRRIVVELQDALRQHIKGLRKRFAAYPFLVERRSRNDDTSQSHELSEKSEKAG
jgi:signal transduction histidine kinase